MEILILGSAAAEGWPAPFCDCPACAEARRRGGVNIRTRQGALIDDDLKIDFGPDTVIQLQRCRRSLTKLRTILFTHQHHDHLTPTELAWASPKFTNTPPQRPIQVYGNAHVLAGIEPVLARYPDARYDLHLMRPLEAFTTVTGDRVLPLAAAHSAPDSLLLRVERRGKSLLYGLDSGLYPTQTLDALGQAGPLDVAIFDCTHAGQKTDNKGHMDDGGVMRMIDALRSRGAIAPHTRLIATHFSHNGKLLHEEIVRLFLPRGVETAYDGMLIQVD